jgi:ABC-2 type transport system ATP-binding protein
MNSLISLTDTELRYRGGSATPPPVRGPLTLDIPAASDGPTVVGLAGRNGAGKSTLLGLIAGQLRPTAGSVTVGGREAFDDPDVLRTVSLTGVDVDYPAAWPVSTVLRTAARRFPQWDAATATRLCEAFGVALSTAYGDLSRGQRSAVGIIVGLASGTPVTLLDEPYVGLDAQGRRLVSRELLGLEESRTVILATHELADLERTVSRLLVLDRGQLTHDLDPAELGERFIRVTGSATRVDAVLTALRHTGTGEVLSHREMAGAARAELDLGTLTDATALRPTLAEVLTEPLSTEDAVVQLTGGEL